jgi:uncharacterized membrane protein YfcA
MPLGMGRSMDSLSAWLVTALACFLVGLSKGGLGGMIGIFITAMISLVLPAEKVIGQVLPLLMIGDVFAVAAHWGEWDRRLVMRLIPGALVGVGASTYLLGTISGEDLRVALGVIVLLFVGYKLLEGRLLRRIDFEPRRIHGWLAGILSGITSTLAHGGGPPVNIFLLIQNLKPQTLVASAALYFLVLNWLKVPSYLLAGAFDWGLIRSTTWFMPLIPVGVWAGKWFVRRVDRVCFERALILLLGVSGIFLLAR